MPKNLGDLRLRDLVVIPKLCNTTNSLRRYAESIAPFRNWSLDSTLEDTYQLFSQRGLVISAYNVKQLHADYLALQAS